VWARSAGAAKAGPSIARQAGRAILPGQEERVQAGSGEAWRCWLLAAASSQSGYTVPVP